MENISSKIFLCYAWEDTAAVKRAVKELEYDLDAKISSDTEFTKRVSEVNEEILRTVENTEVFLLFLSDVSKNVDYVKQCVMRAQKHRPDTHPHVGEFPTPAAGRSNNSTQFQRY